MSERKASMGDKVYRGDVVKYIRNHISLETFMHRTVKKADEACWNLCDQLNFVPAIEEEPEPHWIPVSERLPEEKQDVLIAFKHNMAVGFWEDILNDGGRAWYANSGNGWFTGTEAVDDDGYPIAWMPLPEPWEGDANED